MKNLILIFSFCIISNAFSQKTDLVNAPLNPIALKYKLEHFNLKGDVFCYDSKYYFNKEGFLISKSDYQGDKTYEYENGKLKYFEINNQGFIAKNGNYQYSYNDKGLLVEKTETIKNYGKNDVITQTKYTYDNLNRLILEEVIKTNILYSSTTYSYKKTSDILVVNSETKQGTQKPILKEERYKNGRLIFSKSSIDSIELKIESSVDAKGNSIEDKYINNGTLTDTFDFTIVYYSDANKPIDYKIVIKKGTNGNLYQHIYRNGKYFYSPLKVKLESSNDLLFYDELTKNYYLAKNAYDNNLTEGTTINVELISKNNEALVQTFPNNRFTIYYKCENILLNSINAKATYSNSHLFCYLQVKKTSKEKTFFFRNAQNKLFTGGEVLPDSISHLYYYVDGATNKDAIILKGAFISTTTFSDFKNIEGGGKLAYVNNVPTYTFPDYFNMEDDKIYVGRLYNEKTDIIIQTQTNTQTLNTATNAPKETCLSGNCTDGYGKIQTKDNSTIKGFFKYSQPNGYGVERYNIGDSYQGFFVNGLRNGYGVYYWKSTGTYYYGQWKDGKQHGYGYYQKSAKVTQAGYYENGKQTINLMTQDYLNNIKRGNCIGNCSNGFGQYVFSDGSWYFGFFANNKMQHLGVYKWASTNDLYLGLTNYDKLTGQGMLSYGSSSNTLCGEFYNLKINGLGVYFDKSQQEISKGYWENGTLKTPY